MCLQTRTPYRRGLRGSPWHRARELCSAAFAPSSQTPGARRTPGRGAAAAWLPTGAPPQPSAACSHRTPTLRRPGWALSPSALPTSARSPRQAVPVASQRQVLSRHTFRRSSWAERYPRRLHCQAAGAALLLSTCTSARAVAARSGCHVTLAVIAEETWGRCEQSLQQSL